MVSSFTLDFVILGFILKLFQELFFLQAKGGTLVSDMISIIGPVKHSSVQFGFGTSYCYNKNMSNNYIECL
jgi:hypothetical protein